MEHEVNMKMVCIVTQSSEKVSQVFFNSLQKFIANQNNRKKAGKDINEEQAGKIVKVKDLRKDGSQVDCEKIGPEAMKGFRKYARKYGVAYSMEKKSTDPPTYMIYFKAKDGMLIRKAMAEFVGDKIAEGEKDKDRGIVNALVEAKDKVSKQPKKVRNKEQIR